MMSVAEENMYKELKQMKDNLKCVEDSVSQVILNVTLLNFCDYLHCSEFLCVCESLQYCCFSV